MKIYILEDAFWSMLLCSIEVFPKECLGLLIGTTEKGKSVVNKAVVFQTAVRHTKGVSFPKTVVHEDVITFLETYLPHLKVIGDFHSHTKESELYPSEIDKQAMEEKQVYFIIQIYEKKKKISWQYNNKKTLLYGTSGKFHFKIGAWYRERFDEDFKLAEIECPYAIGLSHSEKK